MVSSPVLPDGPAILIACVLEFLRYNIRRRRDDRAQTRHKSSSVKAFVCTVQFWPQVFCSRNRVDDNQKEKAMEFLIFSIIIAGLLVLVAPRFIPPQLSVLHCGGQSSCRAPDPVCCRVDVFRVYR